MSRTSRPKRPGGSRWRRLVKLVVQRDLGRCWICGHLGAKSGDHVDPCSENEAAFWQMSNVRAAHSYPYGCTDCTYAAQQLGVDPRPVYCNERRQDDPVEKGRARIERITGLKLPTGGDPDAVEGREW